MKLSKETIQLLESLPDRYYNGMELIRRSKNDLEGRQAGTLIVTSNRSDGKTSFFQCLALSQAISTGRECVYVVRSITAMSGYASAFSEMLNRYFPGFSMEEKIMVKNTIVKLTVTNEEKNIVLGYVLNLKKSDDIKKYSPVFGKVDFVIFEEYQTETGKYLKNEITELQSLFVSVARGDGEASRKDVVLVLLGNYITMLNPYYLNLGIDKRYRKETRFLRGNGWIAEFNFNKQAADAIKAHPVARTFETGYIDAVTDKNFYFDSEKSIVKKKSGAARYLFTLVSDSRWIGIRLYAKDYAVHCSSKIDNSCLNVVTLDTTDYEADALIIRRNNPLFTWLREAYDFKKLTFETLGIKEAVMEALGIDAMNRTVRKL